MELTNREAWTAAHGVIFGALFLLAFAGGFAGLWSLRPEWVTKAGLRERMIRLKVGVSVMALTAWVTVVTGTYVVYPWYREPTLDSPRSLLLADPDTAEWHTFGMEWKEHVAWISPLLATAVAFIVIYYGNQLIVDRRLRWTALALFTLAFAVVAVSGLLGAFITKAAPLT
ncbi:MAG: hypothetical protein WEC75_09360 [Dehalococcoidia bacterium]